MGTKSFPREERQSTLSSKTAGLKKYSESFDYEVEFWGVVIAIAAVASAMASGILAFPISALLTLSGMVVSNYYELSVSEFFYVYFWHFYFWTASIVGVVLLLLSVPIVNYHLKQRTLEKGRQAMEDEYIRGRKMATVKDVAEKLTEDFQVEQHTDVILLEERPEDITPPPEEYTYKEKYFDWFWQHQDKYKRNEEGRWVDLATGEVIPPSRLHLVFHWLYTNLLVLGQMGMGKSVFLSQFIRGIKGTIAKRGVIFDSKPEFAHMSFEYGKDHLFKPGAEDGHPDSIIISFKDDLRSESEIKAFASVVIPENPKATQPFFENAARLILTAVLSRCLIDSEDNSNASIAYYLTCPREENPEDDELITVLRDVSQTCPISRESLYRRAISVSRQENVRSSLAEATSALVELCSEGEGNFSLRRFVDGIDEDGNPKNYGWLYLMMPVEKKESLAPLISAMVALMVGHLLEATKSVKKKEDVFAFVLDEFGNLPRPGDAITQLLTLGRSFGVFSALAGQELSRIKEVHGEEAMGTYFNGTLMQVYLGITDEFTTEYLSKTIGETEVWRTKFGDSFSTESEKDGSNSSRERTKVPAVMASEIASQEMFDCYAVLPSRHLVRGRIPTDFVGIKNEDMREYLSMERGSSPRRSKEEPEDLDNKKLSDSSVSDDQKRADDKPEKPAVKDVDLDEMLEL